LLWNGGFWDYPRGLAAVLDLGDEIGDAWRPTAIKPKFGETSFAQVNELLCKFLAYNVCCVIRSVHELGLELNF
jgi:hypothetical protein